MIPNRTLIGNRGSGKSVSLEVMLTEIADDASVLLIDWPGNLADRMTARMWERGQEGRLIVDKARWTDRMPQWPFRPDPTASDPLTRRMEEQAANENLLTACFARRYQKDATLAPATYRSALAAISVFFGISEPDRPSLDRLPHLLRLRDPLGQWMLAETTDRDAASFFQDALKVASRSPQQWEALVGAGGRLLDVLASPVIWPRNGRSLDWKDVIASRRHFYLGMEGLPETTATSLAILTYASAIQAAKELAEATGKSHPLVIVLEEAGSLGLVTPIITTAMQAYRKYGVSVWIVSQTVNDFRDASTLDSVLAMSEHYWHQMTSGVERAARDCANPTFDPNRVLHTRTRTVVSRYERLATETSQFSAGGSLRGRSRGTAFRPVLTAQTEETYDNPANHEAEFRRKLSTLGVGERFFRGLDGTVRRETVALPDPPWGPFADEEITRGGRTQVLGRHRLDDVHRSVRSSLLYQPPPVWNLPPSLPRSEPTPIRTPPTGVEPSGMSGS